jgi:hypothetical protein
MGRGEKGIETKGYGREKGKLQGEWKRCGREGSAGAGHDRKRPGEDEEQEREERCWVAQETGEG